MKWIKFCIPSKGFDLFGVRIINFKHHTEDGPLRLRLCRLKDLPVFYSPLKLEVFLDASGAELQIGSLASFYKWIRSRFQKVEWKELVQRYLPFCFIGR